MPLVRIEILKGKSQEYKKTLLDAVHDALETAIGIPDWDRFQRLYELEPECFERAPGTTAEAPPQKPEAAPKPKKQEFLKKSPGSCTHAWASPTRMCSL